LAKKVDSLWPPKLFGEDGVGEDRDVREERRPGLRELKGDGARVGSLYDLMAKSRKLRGLGCRWRRGGRRRTTSAAVTGLPSENFTPGRSANVQVFPSELTVWPWASHGVSTPCGS